MAAAFRHTNNNAGITGVLVCIENYYMQLIEGSKDEVRNLYERISTDKRHYDCTILFDQHVHGRTTLGWFVHPVAMSIDDPILSPYTFREKFQPDQLSSGTANELMKDIIKKYNEESAK